MKNFAKTALTLALGLGLSTSAFAQSGPTPKAPMAPVAPAKTEVTKSDVSKAAPAAPKTHDVNAKAPAKSSAVKPAEVKKSESGTANTTAKDLSKPVK